jgi:oligosaccharyltransferase complex subunit gamma
MKLVITTTSVLGVITLVGTIGPHLWPIIQNRNVWAAVSLLMVLLFTSGQMFNHIRKVPYVAGDGRGGISYFAGGFQNQFGMETQIVAALCKLSSSWCVTLTDFYLDGVLAFASINLALKCPRMADSRTQQVAVLAWGAVIFVVYSMLLNVFRFKNGGYPFYLPPF